jgi:DNA-binding NarL/FixJ family response regulator
VKILLTDPHPQFRQGLRTLLELGGYSVVGEASDGVEALRMVEKERPDVLVLDINTPLLNGFEIAREIRKRRLDTKLVVLAIFRDDTSVMEAFRAGVNGFVDKARTATDLVVALEKLESGKLFLSPNVTDLLVKPVQRSPARAGTALTNAEQGILQGLIGDRTTADIASELGLPVHSVESSRADIMRKLQVSNIGGMLRHAVRHGLLKS